MLGVRGGTARFYSKSCSVSLPIDEAVRRKEEQAVARLTKNLFRSIKKRIKGTKYQASLIRTCTACGKAFLPPKTAGKRTYCCSPECKRKIDRKHGRIGKAQRRARIRCLPHEAIDPFAVFDRDNWTCQICGDKTPRSLRGANVDKSPELDHIISLADGGPHMWSNVQCSCRACNGAKGAGSMSDQLRLELQA